MATIAKMAVQLTGNVVGFQAAMRSAGKSLNTFTGAFTGVRARLAGLAAALTGVGVAAFIRSATQSIDATAKLADQLGFTTQQLAAYQHAASLAGASSQTLDTSLRMFVRRMGEAQAGSASAVAAFARIGLEADKLASMSTDDALQAVADQFKALPNPAAKAAGAMDLFGRSGMDMILLLEQGSAGLKHAQREAERLGIAFDRTSAGSIARARDAMANMQASLKGLAMAAAITAAPAIQRAADVISNMATSLRQVSSETWRQVLTWTKWAAQIAATVWGLRQLIRIAGTLVNVYRAVTKAQVIMLAMSGKGLAVLAAGALAAAAGVWAVDKAFNAVSASIQSVQQTDPFAGMPTLAAADAENRRRHAAQHAIIQGTGQLQEAVDKLTQSLQLQIDTLGMSAHEAELHKLAVEGATESQLAFARSLAGYLSEANKAEDLRRGIDSLNSGLMEQINTLGMSANQMAIYKLQLEGATAAQLEQAKALAALIDQMEDQQAVQREMEDDAQRIWDSTRTAAEKYEQTLERINQLVAAGKLDTDTAWRARQQALEALERDQERGRTRSVRQDVAAIERRFTAGMRIQQRDDVPRKQLAVQQRQLTEAQGTNRRLDGLRQNQPAVVDI